MSKGQNTSEPTILVIFGVTGDLSHRYLLPALYEISKSGSLPPSFKVLGVSRRQVSPSEAFDVCAKVLKKSASILTMNLAEPSDYKLLKNRLDALSKTFKDEPQIIFYLVVPPVAALPIIKHLGNLKLGKAKTKLLLEKPFGVDLESAHELITQTTKHFSESQIYRIDHYLAKEMAQNIVVFLGSNVLFQNVWNKDFIEKIDIVASETIGIEGRAELWESTGSIRDFLQSHLLQLAALVLMEPCSGVFEFEELPRRRLAALNSLKQILPGDAVRAQYIGYRKEVNNPKSLADTFVSVNLHSTDPRWAGVPITLTTGKNLDKRLTEIRVYFKKTETSQSNLLIMRIQPDEAIELDLWIKQPGYDRKLKKLTLDFAYGQHFSHLPNAYEQVLFDAMRGSHSLFASSDEVLASWKILQPVLDYWSMHTKDLRFYKPGSTIDQVLS